ncbi:hypothetical protein [Methylobacterium sp. CCH5-D2]|uniref:hypothetical protein n=1 Tax=Methylobacterium sp. CCH5-D2 TaxID=1768765 RepID=UPI000829CCA1|nr:hypothetical protein [Methylobacterium sp. CCH5-D2]
MQQAGRRIATLELARRAGEEALHRVVQLKGPCNGRPPAAVSKAAEAFYAAERERIRGASGLRAAFPGITATFSEERV